jgi:hypothetical protein
MSETVFNKVDYDLGTLIKYIGLGEIGLPDIQRPFVWPNVKVRDLFDSMYKGYPVGYLLFWQNELAKRSIGEVNKQKPPKLVIVDGQQRLTSLYAVVKKIAVLRKNFEREYIQIAFNPLEEKFEVYDAAIKRDKEFIPNISILWDEATDVFEVVDNYLQGLKTTREVTDDEVKSIKKSISKLHGLLSFPFTALELVSDIDEESVSDVFVRINSKGTTLKQSDFILTLMSVFWDEGRKALEQFCCDSRKPSKGRPSPFNYFIEPSPDQLLRVGVGVAFKRARLQYVYSILRGKDLETGEFSEDRRIQQFDVLKNAQDRVLNLQYWHDFMKCIRQAGFLGNKMISSQNNLLFSYILYLIGRTEYKVPELDLRRAISRWFFMSAVTGRFTGSPESAMEFDLAGLRIVKTSEEFVKYLNRVCDLSISSDFWGVTLQNHLATSSPRSPSLFAYYAALVLLDAKALFSRIRVAELLDPSINATCSGVERHHLFPKEYLKNLGITSTRDTNQIANYAFMEWFDNRKVSDKAPAEYLPEMKDRFKDSDMELAKLYKVHALPEDWEQMEYWGFLEKRRELMAKVISLGYSTLVSEEQERDLLPQELDLVQIIDYGESEAVEFKSTLSKNLHTGMKDPRIELAALKTIAAFLNTKGGTLIIGVSDDGNPVGIRSDDFENEDKMGLHLVNIVKSRMNAIAITYMHIHFDDLNDHRVMVVKCKKSPVPVFVKDGIMERFYIRTGAAASELTPSQTQEYIKQRFKV